MSCQPVKLQHAGERDRARIARIRAPRGMGPFVHYNWFWLDRALADAAITFARMYDRLGFTEIGEKIDGETGIRDRLVELRL